MDETPEVKEPPGAESTAEETTAPGKPAVFRLKAYLMQVAALFAIGIVLEKVGEHLAPEGISSLNHSIQLDVESWTPWHFSSVYYDELLNGGMFSIPAVKAVAARVPQLFFVAAIVNIPPAAFTTLKRYFVGTPATPPPPTRHYSPSDLRGEKSSLGFEFAEGPATPPPPGESRTSVITGLITLALGALAVILFFKLQYKTIDGCGFWLSMFLLAPLIGSVIIWLVSLVMLVATSFVGGLLPDVGIPVHYGVSLPLVAELGRAAFKPIEHSAADKLIHRALHR